MEVVSAEMRHSTPATRQERESGIPKSIHLQRQRRTYCLSQSNRSTRRGLYNNASKHRVLTPLRFPPRSTSRTYRRKQGALYSPFSHRSMQGFIRRKGSSLANCGASLSLTRRAVDVRRFFLPRIWHVYPKCRVSHERLTPDLPACSTFPFPSLHRRIIVFALEPAFRPLLKRVRFAHINGTRAEAHSFITPYTTRSC